MGEAVANIIYSTAGSLVDMNDDKETIYARDNEVHETFSLLFFYSQ
jgi:hypothetical protein